MKYYLLQKIVLSIDLAHTFIFETMKEIWSIKILKCCSDVKFDRVCL